jgi:hypothetical protein
MGGSMKNVPTKIRKGQWLPALEGETPDEEPEIWVDQTMVPTRLQAERHGLSMLEAYEAGRRYERKEILKKIQP